MSAALSMDIRERVIAVLGEGDGSRRSEGVLQVRIPGNRDRSAEPCQNQSGRPSGIASPFWTPCPAAPAFGRKLKSDDGRSYRRIGETWYPCRARDDLAIHEAGGSCIRDESANGRVPK